ncbi:MAG: hypothetical protein JWO86_7043 [Myxococcaceae bacterium]|nr:hypothetical protein [Myxococcaceae bacterium]
MPFWVEEIQTTRLLMPSRLLHALFTFATLVVATLIWLVPSVAHASESNLEASFSASLVPHTPALFASAAAPLSALAPPSAPAPIGVATPTDRAPLCDPRGAITFASAPQMQDVEVTLDTGLTLDDCFGPSTDEHTNHASRGRAPLPSDASSASTDAAVLRAAVVLAASGRELLPAPGPSTSCSRPGIRSTVDRPPRA